MKKNGIVGFNKSATKEDIRCVLLARLGFSYKTINKQTGYSNPQIYKRLKESGSLVSFYRACITPISRKVIQASNKSSDVIIEKITKQLENAK